MVSEEYYISISEDVYRILEGRSRNLGVPIERLADQALLEGLRETIREDVQMKAALMKATLEDRSERACTRHREIISLVSFHRVFTPR